MSDPGGSGLSPERIVKFSGTAYHEVGYFEPNSRCDRKNVIKERGGEQVVGIGEDGRRGAAARHEESEEGRLGSLSG